MSPYPNLENWSQEKKKRTSKELAGAATKKIRINMMKINDPKETQDHEEHLEGQGYKICLLGNICSSQKDKGIRLLDKNKSW